MFSRSNKIKFFGRFFFSINIFVLILGTTKIFPFFRGKKLIFFVEMQLLIPRSLIVKSSIISHLFIVGFTSSAQPQLPRASVVSSPEVLRMIYLYFYMWKFKNIIHPVIDDKNTHLISYGSVIMNENSDRRSIFFLQLAEDTYWKKFLLIAN